MIIADMALLLIIFAGVFVLHSRGSVTFGLNGLLWRQVRGKWQFSLAEIFLFRYFFSFDKGVTWIALGCVAEVLPLVSAASLSFPPFFYLYFVCVVGIHSVAFEWYVSIYL